MDYQIIYIFWSDINAFGSCNTHNRQLTKKTGNLVNQKTIVDSLV